MAVHFARSDFDGERCMLVTPPLTLSIVRDSALSVVVRAGSALRATLTLDAMAIVRIGERAVRNLFCSGLGCGLAGFCGRWPRGFGENSCGPRLRYR